MGKQVSPFASLSGAEKQIKWLEYQSVRLPYVQGNMDESIVQQEKENTASSKETRTPPSTGKERPQPSAVPSMNSRDFQKSRHSQYDSIIARLKQAELQSRQYSSQLTKQ